MPTVSGLGKLMLNWISAGTSYVNAVPYVMPARTLTKQKSAQRMLSKDISSRFQCRD
jgi:hypothetical protein